MAEETLQGKPVSPGIAIGPVFLYTHDEIDVPQDQIQASDVARELSVYAEACEKVGAEILEIIQRTERQNEADILNTHMLLLNDFEIAAQVRQGIENQRWNAAKAIDTAFREVADMMSAIDDPYLLQRAADIHDIRHKLLRQVLHIPAKDLSTASGILVSNELYPSDFKQFDRKRIAGVLTEQGESTSHAAIMARNLGIPVVFGVRDVTKKMRDGEIAVINGSRGEVILAPTPATEEKCRQLYSVYQKSEAVKRQYLFKNCATKDGQPITVEVNAGSLEADFEKDCKCSDGIGLFRTEFLYMESAALPDEETQFRAYRHVLQAFAGKPVIIRTLDIGADKQLPYLPLVKEENPALGNRAIRYCMANPELFRVQLRALLRASVYGNLWIMFPMISGVEDYHNVRDFCDAVRLELEACGIPLSNSIRYGIMIEIPSAAVMAEELAGIVDFASIGTNDLTQYTLAIDRVGRGVEPYYRPLHPALARLLHHISTAFSTQGKPLGVCGELAGSPEGALLLTSLGIRQLSMDSSKIAGVKYVLSQFEAGELDTIGAYLLKAENERQIWAKLREELTAHNVISTDQDLQG